MADAVAPRRRGLLRSTSVRQALGIVLSMAVLSVTTAGIAYLRLREAPDEAIVASLDHAAASFSTARTADDLRRQVAAEAAATDPEIRVVALSPPDGQPIGNAIARLGNGLPALAPIGGDRPLSDLGYEVRVIRDARGTLVLGESREAIDQMSDVFIGLIALSLVPTLLLSLAAALVIAARSARRVVRIEETLARLSDGDLRDRVAEGSPEGDLAARAMTEADRAVSVFQSLLQIAQIEGGSPKVRFRAVDLSAIVATFADIYGPTAEDSGHTLEIDAPPDRPVSVDGDKNLLGQVVANLIENGLHHTPAGSTIRLSLRKSGEGVTLSMADDGPGVPAVERDFVLRRLSRLERSRTTPRKRPGPRARRGNRRPARRTAGTVGQCAGTGCQPCL